MNAEKSTHLIQVGMKIGLFVIVIMMVIDLVQGCYQKKLLSMQERIKNKPDDPTYK